MSISEPAASGRDTLAILRRLVVEARAMSEQPSIEGEIDQDDPLTAYVDSMGLATLVELIEDHWDLELTDDEIDPDNFATLRTLGRMLDER